MEFTMTAEGRLKIAVDRAEASRLPVSLERFDRRAREARGLLVSMLDQGKARTGFSPRDSKVFVEICPDAQGGWVVYFTVMNQKAGARNDIPWLKPYIFAFRDADTLIGCCLRLSRRHGHRLLASSLYRCGGEYMLVVYPLDYADGLTVYMLAEYGRFAGDGELAAAHVGEHGKLLIAAEAVRAVARIEGGKGHT